MTHLTNEQIKKYQYAVHANLYFDVEAVIFCKDNAYSYAIYSGMKELIREGGFTSKFNALVQAIHTIQDLNTPCGL